MPMCCIEETAEMQKSKKMRWVTSPREMALWCFEALNPEDPNIDDDEEADAGPDPIFDCVACSGRVTDFEIACFANANPVDFSSAFRMVEAGKFHSCLCAYLAAMVARTRGLVSYNCLAVASVLLSRVRAAEVATFGAGQRNEVNAREYVVIAVLIAWKVLGVNAEQEISLGFWEATTGFPRNVLRRMEVEFLRRISWRTNVSADEFDRAMQRCFPTRSYKC